jgi:outer membrane protein insertion porin family
MINRRFLLHILLGFCLLSPSLISRSLRAQTSSVSIAEIRFEGNESIPTEQLKRLLSKSQEGSLYTPEILAADLQRVETAYRDEGFLRAKVGPADVRMQSSGEEKTAVLIIRIVEGTRYRVGEVTIRNAQTLAPETLLQMCPLKKGMPYSRVKIYQWQVMIEDAYREMGYIRIRCKVNESLNEIDKVVDCTLECEEGRAYSIGKITLIGDKSIDRMQFKRHLLFSEGGIFNPDMVTISIQYLNRSGLYRPISSSDVQLNVDDEKGTVDLTLRVFSARQ